MKIYELQAAYMALQGVKISTLRMDDVKVILNFRKEARPHIEAFEAFAKDVDEAMKPADFDELVEIERKGDKATPEEIAHHRRAVTEYRNKILEAIAEERSKDVEVAHGTLSAEAYDQLLKAKEWTVEEWESVGFFF